MVIQALPGLGHPVHVYSRHHGQTTVLVKVVVFDASRYIVQYFQPTVDVPAGDTIFDPTLSMVPHFASAAFYALCGCITMLLSHVSTLVSRILLRQPVWQWPPISDRPWTFTSITDFWSFGWHQLFRRIFVAFGLRPGWLGAAGETWSAHGRIRGLRLNARCRSKGLDRIQSSAL